MLGLVFYIEVDEKESNSPYVITSVSGTRSSSSARGASAFGETRPLTTFHSAPNVPASVIRKTLLLLLLENFMSTIINNSLIQSIFQACPRTKRLDGVSFFFFFVSNRIFFYFFFPRCKFIIVFTKSRVSAFQQLPIRLTTTNRNSYVSQFSNNKKGAA